MKQDSQPTDQTKPLARGLGGILCGWLLSAQALPLWALFAAVAVANIANVRFAVALNEWNGRFFDALQKTDAEALYAALFDFAWLAGAVIVMLVMTQYVKSRLLLSLRRELTFRLIDVWLSPAAAHYQLRENGREPDNPDQRIIEDSRALTGLAVGLALSFLESVLTIGSFSVILWTLSGSVTVMGVEIPGYMFWVCLSYTVVATAVTHWIGRPLKRLNYASEAKEADLRYAFIEKRRHAEAIAGARGECAESARLKLGVRELIDVLIAFVKKQRDLDLFTVGLGQVTHLAPIFFSLPALFSGHIQLGGLMQIRGAFTDVARSFSWFIFVYEDLAKLAAAWERLSGLVNELEAADAEHREHLARMAGGAASGALAVRIDLRVPGTDAARGIALSAAPGETVFVTGPSGAGKSTLLKALAGFYGDYTGSVARSDRGGLFWLPQKPYLFKGTLSDNLLYPKMASTEAAELEALLHAFGLGHLAPHLLESADWTNILSGGEQQRVVLIRAVLARPRLLLLDEATSALDSGAARRVLTLIRERLPEVAVVFVTHQECFEGEPGKRVRLA